MAAEQDHSSGRLGARLGALSWVRRHHPLLRATPTSLATAPLVAGALLAIGVRSISISATEVIVTDQHHGRAEPLMAQTRQRSEARLRPLLNDGVVPVITGFIGATIEGVQTTLGRGGSDYSATILGAALGASETSAALE